MGWFGLQHWPWRLWLFYALVSRPRVQAEGRAKTDIICAGENAKTIRKKDKWTSIASIIAFITETGVQAPASSFAVEASSPGSRRVESHTYTSVKKTSTTLMKRIPSLGGCPMIRHVSAGVALAEAVRFGAGLSKCRHRNLIMGEGRL